MSSSSSALVPWSRIEAATWRTRSGQVHVLGVGAVEPQDRLAGALGLGGHRGLHVGDRGVQVAGPGQGVGVEVVVQLQPGVLEAGGDLAGGLGLALVAAAGDHHPGAGGRLVLERVGLDPAAQHPGHGLAHRGLLQREVGVRGGPVQVVAASAAVAAVPARRPGPAAGAGVNEPLAARHCCQPASVSRAGGGPGSTKGAGSPAPLAMRGCHGRSCPRAARCACGPPGSSSGRRSMLPWRRASRISGAGSGRSRPPAHGGGAARRPPRRRHRGPGPATASAPPWRPRRCPRRWRPCAAAGAARSGAVGGGLVGLGGSRGRARCAAACSSGSARNRRGSGRRPGPAAAAAARHPTWAPGRPRGRRAAGHRRAGR